MSIEVSDILRKLAFGQAFILSVLTIWIIVRYTKKVLVTPADERAKPTHVALIASGYLFFMGYIVEDLYERIGTPLTWRIPTALAGFTFSLAALAFMMSHLSARRVLQAAFARRVEAEANKEIARQLERTEHRMRRMEEVGQYTHDTIQEMKEGDVTASAERAGLAKSVEIVGEKADAAYHEANDLNLKIAGFNEEVSGKLTDIKDNAETARVKAVEAVEKAEDIGETGKDTNIRVRNIQEAGGHNTPPPE